MSPPDAATPGRTRRWASEVWYQIQIWTLALLALLVVAFIVSAIVLANWPGLAGAYKPMVKDENTVQQPDRRQMRERWKYEGYGGSPAGRGPAEANRTGAPTAAPEG